MLKISFLIVFSFLLCTQGVLSEWVFALTTSSKIIFYDENWSEVNSAAHKFEGLSAIAFDEIEERIYFHDYKHNKSSIFALKLPLGKFDSANIESVLARTPNERIGAITFDPLKRNILWTDRGNRKILTAPVDSDEEVKPKVFMDFSDNDTIPDGIAVDICRRKLYWTSSNSENPSIQTASLNSSDHKILIDTNLHFPHGIVVDQFSDRIFYVVDQYGIHFTVESSKLDGSDRQIIVESVNNQPQSLTVTEDFVFWTDVMHKTIWKMPKLNHTGVHPIAVKSFDYDWEINSIVSRIGMLKKLKFDADCKDTMERIQKNWDIKMKKSEITKEENEKLKMICLNDGLFAKATNSCSCEDGYSGRRCEINECHNFCIHGTCKIVDGDASCTCNQGYEGHRCQMYKCHNYCFNRGGCKIVHSDAVCNCTQNFYGPRCEINLHEACPPFCMLLQKKIEVHLPQYCHGFCKNLLLNEADVTDVTDVADVTTYETITVRAQENIDVCRNTWNKSVIVIVVGVLGALVLIYLIIKTIRHVYKPARPRIKKTFVVQKKISQTPLTCRPIATEQCEITIENCCNMNICDTPCFDSKLLQQNMSQSKRPKSPKEDKEILIGSMENDSY